ncbi:hypothetical protein K437DRAFT_132732 [Tilletiaria anomala UBC 951]|uniref:Zn(2)-C6 fungal-type domain-containing protein n=1 Tax=Tilletiaria anomala (strain ATCC 24038 / CBS 436.72 / UBC 951) TaxID=1037660 RepID=A0A066WPM0_TILAU|nr:uncharacterized protein K437DRAFT_132732 [Tilletiaria anomala UBC 951]KDN52934.1 hypothetical protein K437DRAFT_132732 [Tilletiaria anomala UBC 951]
MASLGEMYSSGTGLPASASHATPPIDPVIAGSSSSSTLSGAATAAALVRAGTTNPNTNSGSHHPPFGHHLLSRDAAMNAGGSNYSSSNTLPPLSASLASHWPAAGGLYRSSGPFSGPPTPPFYSSPSASAPGSGAGPGAAAAAGSRRDIFPLSPGAAASNFSNPPTPPPPLPGSSLSNMKKMFNHPYALHMHPLPPPSPSHHHGNAALSTHPRGPSALPPSFGALGHYNGEAQREHHVHATNKSYAYNAMHEPTTKHAQPSATNGSGNSNRSTGDASMMQDDADDDALNPPPLRRNQACLSCRKRKLKCDAARPVCSTCKKSREAAAAARHPPPVPDGDCVYKERSKRKTKRAAPGEEDTLDGEEDAGAMATTIKKARKADSFQKDSAPDCKVGQLEDRIRHLERLLMESFKQKAGSAGSGGAGQGGDGGGGAVQSWIPTMHTSRSPDGQAAKTTGTATSPMSASPSTACSVTDERKGFHYRARLKLGIPSSSSSSISSAAQQRSDSITPHESKQLFELDGVQPLPQEKRWAATIMEPDPLLNLLWPDWPPDLPSPDTVLHLSEIFFARHPLRVMIYKPSFMTSLSLPPRHPDRPAIGLIHAILAAAAPLSPFFEETSKPPTRAATPSRGMPDGLFGAASGAMGIGANLGSGADGLGSFGEFGDFPLLSEMLDGTQYAAPDIGQGINLMDGALPQAADTKMSFANFHLSRARAKVSRALVTSNSNPLDWVQAMIIIADALFTEGRLLECFLVTGVIAKILPPCGLFKLHPYQEAAPSFGCYLPPSKTAPEEHERRITFWCAYLVEASYSHHGLHFESSINDSAVYTTLTSSIADFQAGRDSEPNLQTLASEDLFQNGHVDEFNVLLKAVILHKRIKYMLARNDIGEAATHQPAGFRELDANILQLLHSAPPLKDPNSLDLLAARLTTVGALANLHEPFLNVTDPESYSYRQVEFMVREVMRIVELIESTSFDPTLLHPRSSMTFHKAATLLAAKIEFARKSSCASEREMAEYMGAYDRLTELLRRMATKIKVAQRSYESLMLFRNGTWDQALLAEAMAMSGVIPDKSKPESTNGDYAPHELL